MSKITLSDDYADTRQESYIQLNLTDAPPTEYNYSVGNVVPIQETEKEKYSKLEAAFYSLPPVKAGYASAYYADRLLRQYDKKSGFERIDEDFDPVDVWKKNGHRPEEFDEISRMTNIDQYSLYKSVSDHERDTTEALGDLGVYGHAGLLAAQIATDPTTYFGFGAAKMLSKGMSYSKAFALSGVAAGATYEGISQFSDLSSQRDAMDSMVTIASAGVVGSVLGKGVDTWSKLKTSGLVSKDKDFHQFSKQIVMDADSLEPRALSLSADAIKKSPEDSLIFGKAARFSAKMMAPIVPKLKFQTSALSETREFGSKFFGNTLINVSETAGVAKQESLVEATGLIRAQKIGKISKITNEIDDFIAAGNRVTDDDLTQAIVRASDRADDLSDNTASAFIAKRHRQFYDEYAEELDGVSGFLKREDYGVPLVFRPDKIEKNFDSFVDRFTQKFIQSRNALKDDIDFLNEKLSREMAKDKKSLQLVEDLEEEIRLTREFMDTPDSEISSRAIVYAQQIANGTYGKTSMVNPFGGKFMPSRFKQRVFDIKEFAEFIENNPVKLAKMYADEVTPFQASHKIFGERTPINAIKEYSDRLVEKATMAAGQDRALSDKILKEQEKMVKALGLGWDRLTGQHITKAGDLYGSGVLNTFTAARNYISATKLGARVLASMNELGAIIMTRHFSGVKEFGTTLAKMAKSPELRAMSRKDAEALSFAIQPNVHAALGDSLGDHLDILEVRGNGASAKLARSSQWLSHKMEYWSGGVFFDSMSRRIINSVQHGMIKNSIEDLARGKLTGSRLTDLAFLGIEKGDVAPILEQIKKHGKMVDGVFSFNTSEWTDKFAKNKVELALYRDNRRVSINPDAGDTPHIFTVPGANMLFQFKSWSVAAGHIYGLSALQKLDAQHLASLSGFVGLSSLSYMLAEVARGNEPPKDIEEIIYAGVTNSGIFGVMPDYGGHWLANAWGGIEAGGAKFAPRQTGLTTAAGPLGSTITDVMGAVKPVFSAIDPNADAKFDDTWAKNMLDVLPIPLVKPLIKNELITDD